MKDSLIVGLVIGAIAGACLATYNKDVKHAIEKGKNAVKKQFEKTN